MVATLRSVAVGRIGLTAPRRSSGLSQSACSPCDPLAHQTRRKASSDMPALPASVAAERSTVSVTGAFLALRSASQSAQT